MIVSGGQATFDVDAIVFDKDGTLIDLDSTWLAITEAWIEAVANSPADIEVLRDSLGVDGSGFLVPGGVAASGTFREIERATEQSLGDADGTIGQRLAAARRLVSEALPELPVTPIGDVEGAMRRLRQSSLVLCIASSDHEETIARHMEQLQIADLVAAFIGGDGPAIPKPDPAGLFYLSEQVGVPVGRMLMVGDSFTDLGAARNAGAAGILAVAPRDHPSPIEELSDGLIGSIQDIAVIG